jgi:hypothetical protein
MDPHLSPWDEPASRKTQTRSRTAPTPVDRNTIMRDIVILETIVIALVVLLGAGIVGGIYLYRHMSEAYSGLQDKYQSLQDKYAVSTGKIQSLQAQLAKKPQTVTQYVPEPAQQPASTGFTQCIPDPNGITNCYNY